jgi:hypothetical protein
MEQPSESEKPIGLAIIVCEKVITEAVSNNKTIVSTFNNINTKTVPCVQARMSVFVALTSTRGEKQVELVLKKDEQNILKLGGKAIFPDPNHVVELIFNFRNCVFPEQGKYSFEVYADGEYIFERQFNVVMTK